MGRRFGAVYCPIMRVPRYQSRGYRPLSVTACLAAARSVPLGCALLLYGSCERARSSTAAISDVGRPTTSAASPTTRSPPDINDIIDLWTREHHDEAVTAIIALCDSGPPKTRLRPFDFPERDCVAMPRDEREALIARMLATLDRLREMVREMDRRAERAIGTGDAAIAARYVDTIRRLGEANRGPEVTLLVDLVGASFVKRASEKQSQLDALPCGRSP